MKSYHHTSNDYLISSKVNITFDDLLMMSDGDFEKWVLEFRDVVKTGWLEHNQPPVRTIDDENILRQMERLTDIDLSGVLQIDTMTNTEDLLTSVSTIHCPNSFFPNMSKMKDISTTDMEGEGLWDFFVLGKKTNQFIKSISKNFKWDSFFVLSLVISRDSSSSFGKTTGKSWISNFSKVSDGSHSYWLEPVEKVNRGVLTLSDSELGELVKDGLVDETNFNGGVLPTDKNLVFRVRYYKKGQVLFPSCINFLKRGLVMMGVNFPSTISKWIYKEFTEDFKDQDEIIIYDPSMGYGGRLMGSLSLNGDRKIHYLGTDPNTDNWIPELGISRYEYMGRYYNNNIKRRFQTTYQTFMEGSEVVHENENFQKYKGKVDFIFTSPPYFGAEGYSEDETQSYKKFPTYEEWRDGFLTQTLKNCVEWLKPGRWMCWNISDVQFNGKYYPLERDSVELMKSYGMEYRRRYKMVLQGGTTQKALNPRTRLPSTKNFCGVKNVMMKYEPVFCFYKP